MCATASQASRGSDTWRAAQLRPETSLSERVYAVKVDDRVEMQFEEHDTAARFFTAGTVTDVVSCFGIEVLFDDEYEPRDVNLLEDVRTSCCAQPRVAAVHLTRAGCSPARTQHVRPERPATGNSATEGTVVILENVAGMAEKWRLRLTQALNSMACVRLDAADDGACAHRVRLWWSPAGLGVAATELPHSLRALFVRPLVGVNLALPQGRRRDVLSSITTQYASLVQLSQWNTPGTRFKKQDLDEMVRLNVICDCKTGALRNLTTEERLQCLGFAPDHLAESGLTEAQRFCATGNSFALPSLARVLLVNMPRLACHGEPPLVNVCCAFSGIGGAEVVCAELHRMGMMRVRCFIAIELKAELRAVVKRWFDMQEHLKGVQFFEFGDIAAIRSDHFRQFCIGIGGIQLFIGGSPCNGFAGTLLGSGVREAAVVALRHALQFPGRVLTVRTRVCRKQSTDAHQQRQGGHRELGQQPRLRVHAAHRGGATGGRGAARQRSCRGRVASCEHLSRRWSAAHHAVRAPPLSVRAGLPRATVTHVDFQHTTGGKASPQPHLCLRARARLAARGRVA